MRYMGGKSRIAKSLSIAILGATPDRGRYVEPFIGGGAMASKMGQHFDTAIYSDIHPDLVLMWEAALNGWKPPTEVSYELYQKLRYTKEISALRGFVGFGGSFGGRWFEGYARGGNNADGTPRNHQAESSRAVLKDVATMYAKTSTEILCRDAFTITAEPRDVIYCDPPYANTKNYSRIDSLDHLKFWEVAEQWTDEGASVFVSEYAAPAGWECIWEQPLRSSVRLGSEDRHIAIERLFTRKNAQTDKPTHNAEAAHKAAFSIKETA